MGKQNELMIQSSLAPEFAVVMNQNYETILGMEDPHNQFSLYYTFLPLEAPV